MTQRSLILKQELTLSPIIVIAVEEVEKIKVILLNKLEDIQRTILEKPEILEMLLNEYNSLLIELVRTEVADSNVIGLPPSIEANETHHIKVFARY